MCSNQNVHMNDKYNFIIGDKVNSEFMIALNKIVDAVSSTLGPSGKYALIESDSGSIRFTKDGVSVIKAIAGKSDYESVFVKAIQEACIKTNSVVGDGTTSALVLLSAIVNHGHKRLVAGYSVSWLLKGMSAAHSAIVSAVLKRSIKAENKYLQAIASISVNNDKALGKIINDAVQQVDIKYGLISVEEGKGVDVELEFTEGLSFEAGYMSPFFNLSQTNKEIEFDDAYVLVISGNIKDGDIVLKYLEYLAVTNRPGILIANDFDKNLLSTMIINNYQKVVKVCAIRAPDHGEDKEQILEDICVFTGAKKVDLNISGNIPFSNEMVGKCRKVRIGASTTSIIDGEGDKKEIEKRCRTLAAYIEENEQNMSSYKLDALRTRYSKLGSKVAIIKVGASTSSEIGEIKDRILDAVCAVKSSLSHGICIGGGVTLLRAQQDVLNSNFLDSISDKEREGAKLFIESMSATMSRILSNGHFNVDVIIDKIKSSKGNIGFDALNGEVCDMLERGILDSTKVVLTSLDVALSLSKLMLNLSVCVKSSKSFNHTKDIHG